MKQVNRSPDSELLTQWAHFYSSLNVRIGLPTDLVSSFPTVLYAFLVSREMRVTGCRDAAWRTLIILRYWSVPIQSGLCPWRHAVTSWGQAAVTSAPFWKPLSWGWHCSQGGRVVVTTLVQLLWWLRAQPLSTKRDDDNCDSAVP